MLPELTQDEFSAALDGVAAAALLALGEDIPPVDAVVLARALGLAVALDAAQRPRARFVRLGRRAGDQRGSILLRPEPRPERVQWAVAHEVGECLAHLVFAELAVDPREAPAAAREQVANLLAARLLLPAEPFAAEAGQCDWDLFELKAHFSTASHELIARRMLDFLPPVAITVFDHGAMTYRASNLPGRLPTPAPLELSGQRRAHETGRPRRLSGDGQVVCAWPIHERDWKREILRAEFTRSYDDGYIEG